MTTHALAKKSEEARQRLVSHLQKSGAAYSRSVLGAFAVIPREAFVSSFYQDQGRNWIEQTADTLPEDTWLAAIYADESLVTKLSSRNVPISSSSMPSVMARMLEALQVQQGQKVLEIGTGTGYNAALLSYLTGDPMLVTTVEVDAPLAAKARVALEQTVGNVWVQIGDGQQGVASTQRFDRLIATAAGATFPWQWYYQLAPGGRLVMDLAGNLKVSSFFVLEKAQDGKRATGHFLVPPLYFMPMREEPVTSMALPSSSPSRTWSLPANHFLPARLQDASFRWFMQWRLCGLGGSKGVITHPHTRERVTFLRFRDKSTQLDLELAAGKEWRIL